MVPRQSWIALVVLYSFTNWQLLLALENGTAASSAPPSRSSCFPTIGGFLMGAIIGWAGHHLHCSAPNPPTTLPSTASSAVLSTTREPINPFFGVIPSFAAISLTLATIICGLNRLYHWLVDDDSKGHSSSAEESQKKTKSPSNGGATNSDVNDPKMMSTTTSQVQSSASSTVKDIA